MDLYEEAKKQNMVAFLGSGINRRFISLCLIDHFAHQLRGNGNDVGMATIKRSIIIVPNGSQVYSEACTIRNHTDLKVGEYRDDGDVKVPLDQDYWKEQLACHQVLIMTCSLFASLLGSSLITISLVNVLILNECQLVLQDDDYKRVASYIRDSDQSVTRLLAFGPSLIRCNRKPRELEAFLTTIERYLGAKRDTVADLKTSFRSSVKPVNKVMFYEEWPISFELNEDQLYQLLWDLVKFIQENQQAFKPDKCPINGQVIIDCLYQVFNTIKTMGPWCAKELADIYAKELAEYSTNYAKDPALSGILSASMSFFQYIFVTLRQQLSFYHMNQQLQAFVTDRMLATLKVLREYVPTTQEDSTTAVTTTTSRPALCGIIFVEKRSHVRLLCSWLQSISSHIPVFAPIKVDYLVGNVCKAKESALLHTPSPRQENVLLRFRKHEINLLVATSNFEEELDVPRCNLVIRYDFPDTFAQYLFSKQRVRVDNGKFVLLVPKGSDKQAVLEKKLREYVSVESIIKASKLEKVNLPSLQELSSLYPPYTTNSSATVDLSNAPGVLHRYCLRLPSDTFTRLTPLYESETLSDGTLRYIVRLPTNSPIREPIIGPPSLFPEIAQKAAALEACKALHIAGELNDSLFPVGKENNKYLEELGIKLYRKSRDDEDKTPGQERPGTTKRRQNYEKRIAEALRGPGPAPGEPSSIYIFFMNLTCPIPEEQNTRGRKLVNPMDTPRFFGVITRNQVPLICDFPVYTRSGEVMVSMRKSSCDVILDEDQISRIKQFHKFTFNDVLHLVKDPMEYEPDEAPSSFFVIPVNYNKQSASEISSNSPLDVTIDWQFIDKVFDYEKSDFQERREFSFDRSVFEDAVVKPWYRSAKEQLHFYVADICDNLQPTSPFPTELYQTFLDYYLQKYHIEIKDLNQPLLDVDHTSARLNLLTPRFVNRKGMPLPTSTEKTRAAKRENLQSKQLLIPELCIVHPFPASFWNKAVCLPSIIYRVNHLLLAEQLRREVSQNIGIGIVNPSPDFCWPPLDFGWTLNEVLTQVALDKDQDDLLLPSSSISEFKEPSIKSSNRVEFKPTPPSFSSKILDLGPPVIEGACDDLLIDTFDPSVYKVEDEPNMDGLQDEIFDDEIPMEDWNLGGQGLSGSFQLNTGDMPPIADWSDTEPKMKELPDDYDDSKNNGEFRVGSPSNFDLNQESNWDNWDNHDTGPTNVIDLGIPGLHCISAAGGVDLQKLSKDLENIHAYDDFDDSEDEDFLDYDYDDQGRINEDGPMFNSEAAAVTRSKEEISLDIISSGLILSSQKSDLPSKPSFLDEIEIPEAVLNDETIHYTECDTEKMKTIFEYDEVIVPYREADSDSVTENQGTVDSSIGTLKEALDSMEPMAVLTKKVEEKSAKKEAPINIDEDVGPSFGELLPNRDEIQENSRDNEVSSSSLIHLDPLINEFDPSQGPSPAMILQALTMSNASDGINLERLETVGDSFLKYAVTAFMYCRCPDQHEGILSQLRSTQISNLKLYELGSLNKLGELMVATKFEPSDNWLPPGFKIAKNLGKALDNSVTGSSGKAQADNPAGDDRAASFNCLLTQHSIPDKSIADCVEALIGAYLISCGPRGALLFMRWLGLMVMDEVLEPQGENQMWCWLGKIKPPLLFPKSEDKLNLLYKKYGLDRFEKEVIGYEFRDKAFLVQAFTHNSFSDNHITDCYQRLEFLGDAVLDFLITRHLFDDSRQHSPGELTDLRSALANNTFFASLAVEYEFHKYLMYKTADLHRVISKFVEYHGTNGKKRDPAAYSLLLGEGDCEQPEDIEVPKALGDIFESVAGAIFLDSGFSLDTVWKVYYKMMKPEMEYYSKNPPKSPIRELLEMAPQKVSFSKPDNICIQGVPKIRICVDVFGVGKYLGIGRNRRLAKYTAAKRALRELKAQRRTQSKIHAPNLI